VSVTFLFMISCGSAAQQQYKSHSVQKGETVYSIAKQYGISEATIYNLNPDAKNGLKVNSVLIIPSNSVITSGTNNNNYRDHKVKKKETLYGIAQLYNVGVDEIKKMNKELRSEEHTSELQSRENIVSRPQLEKKNNRELRGTRP